MITKIVLDQIATFTGEPQVLNCDSKLNVVYAANGAGKTTISKLIADPSISYKSSVCSNDENSSSLVYNVDFVEGHFNQDIKGIFTLGKNDAQIYEDIDVIKSELETLAKDKAKKNDSLNLKESDLASKQSGFHKYCWGVKNRIDDGFKPALTGSRGSEKVFGMKCVQECLKEQPEAETYEDIVKDIEIVYGDNVQKLSLLPLFDIDVINERYMVDLLHEKVIGKQDVDIAGLIKRLGNADWVFQGSKYLEDSVDVCPFCQETLTRNLGGLITEFFDQGFQEKLITIQEARVSYSESVSILVEAASSIVESGHSYTDVKQIDLINQKVINSFNQNLTAFDNKVKASGESFVYDYIAEHVDLLNSSVIKSNEKIKSHNDKIDRSKEEKLIIVGKVWAYIAKQIQEEFDSYKKVIQGLERAKIGIEEAIAKNGDSILLKQKELLALEEKITSTKHTVNEINAILSGYQFSGFKLSSGEAKGTYKIVRNCGEDAIETLSEGEKTFVTFLYFYHLLKGSVEKGDISKNRIAVFDDPISSLDSNVLFIVSNLIRKLVSETNRNVGYVKQIFILTHNVYFHKEVTYKLSPCKHWIVSKLDNVSAIKEYRINPIKSSYQLMWQELKEVKDTGSITIPNVLRRILETYFKIMGKMNFDDLVDKFVEEERILCSSLVSWTHDGSHNIADDLFVDASKERVESYLSVFEKVFSETGHQEHYNMMMGD